MRGKSEEKNSEKIWEAAEKMSDRIKLIEDENDTSDILDAPTLVNGMNQVGGENKKRMKDSQMIPVFEIVGSEIGSENGLQ